MMQRTIIVIIPLKEAVVLKDRTTASYYSTGSKDISAKVSNTAFSVHFQTSYRDFDNILTNIHYFRPGLVARPPAVVLLIEGQEETLESQQEVAA